MDYKPTPKKNDPRENWEIMTVLDTDAFDAFRPMESYGDVPLELKPGNHDLNIWKRKPMEITASNVPGS